jgi:predicted DNA-binding protein
MKKLSRSHRFQAAVEKVGMARSDIEELHDELQNWLDNLPENLQSGTKAVALQEAIDNLETVISALEEVEGTDVEFPGMFS